MTARVADILLPADIHANRPAAADVPVGAVFPCTTDGTLDRNNGATWDTWATLVGAGVDLDDLGDVDLTGQADGDFLQRVGGVWVPVDAPSGGGGSGEPDLTGPDDLDFEGASSTSMMSGWSWYNQGDSSIQYGGGDLFFRVPTEFDYLRGFYRSLPAGFAECEVSFTAGMGGGDEGFGLFLRESSTNKKAHMTVRANGTFQLTYWNGTDTSTPTALNSGSSYWSAGNYVRDAVMRIRKNSSTSWDFIFGHHHLDNGPYLAHDVTAASGGFTPDQIGWMCLSQNNDAKWSVLHYVKFT